MGDKRSMKQRLAELEGRVAGLECEIYDLRIQLLHKRKPDPPTPYGPSVPYKLRRNPYSVTITHEVTCPEQQPSKDNRDGQTV